jgi:putative membrane protein
VKYLLRVAGLLGLVALAAFVHRIGLGRILALFHQIGWPLLLLVPYRAVPLYLDSRGWRLLFPTSRDTHENVSAAGSGGPPPRWTLFWIAALRESINRLLPVANVGGEIVAVRLLSASGYSVSASAASMIVEVALTTISLCLYAALGAAILIQFKLAPQGLQPLLGGGLLVSAMMAVGLVVLLRFGTVFARIARFIERAMTQRYAELARVVASIDPLINKVLSHPLKIARAVCWQLLGLIAGAFESWLLLRWMGSPVEASTALALDAVAWTLREFIFVVPAGLGVQEAALTALGQALGIGADVALTLSLAKRLREFLFGAPILLLFQTLFKGAAVAAVKTGS